MRQLPMLALLLNLLAVLRRRYGEPRDAGQA
jgi:hypothetical protein